MKRLSFLIPLLFLWAASWCQSETLTGFVGKFQFSGFAAGGTSDVTGLLDAFSDQTNQYFANQILVGDVVWDNLGNRWEVMAVNSSNLLQADVDLRDINSIGGAPVGVGFVSRETPNMGLSLFVPDNNIGISQQLKSRIETHNMLLIDQYVVENQDSVFIGASGGDPYDDVDNPTVGDIYISDDDYIAYYDGTDWIYVSPPTDNWLKPVMESGNNVDVSSTNYLRFLQGESNFLRLQRNEIFMQGPDSVLLVQPGAVVLEHAGSLTNGTGGALLGGARNVAIQGDYAYVVSLTSDALEIVDISDPTSPTHTGSIAHGSGGAILDGAANLFVSGNYAYVTAFFADALEIIDISNPAAPTHAGSIVHGSGGALLDNPTGVFVSGNYAYVASQTSDALEIVNISNPAAPTHAGSITNGTGGALLDEPTSVFVVGNYAYVASQTGDAFEIVNVSNPAAPTHAGSLTNGTGGALLNNPVGVYVQGNYAYVVAIASDALEIIDISNPAAPTHAGSIVHGSGGAQMDNPAGVFVSGNYAYIASQGSSSVAVIDISNPAAPTHFKSITNGTGGALLLTANGLFVEGEYIYVGSSGSSALEVLRLYEPKALSVWGDIYAASYGSTRQYFDTSSVHGVLATDSLGNVELLDLSDISGAGGSPDGNGIYSGSGNVPDSTEATLADGGTFTFKDQGGNDRLKITEDANIAITATSGFTATTTSGTLGLTHTGSTGQLVIQSLDERATFQGEDTRIKGDTIITFDVAGNNVELTLKDSLITVGYLADDNAPVKLLGLNANRELVQTDTLIQASNGLNDADPSASMDFELGGSLEKNTTIVGENKQLNLDSLNRFQVRNAQGNILLESDTLGDRQARLLLNVANSTWENINYDTDNRSQIRLHSNGEINIYNTDLAGTTGIRITIEQDYIQVQGMPTYADDAAADADSSLPAGAMYQVTGDRGVKIKP